MLVEYELNELSTKVEAVTTKGLTKDLTNKYKILSGGKYFSSGILQNYLVFISAKKYFKFFSRTTQNYSRKSNGMSEESIENITTSNNNLAPTSINSSLLPDIMFNGHCLINNISNPKVINLNISHTLDTWSRDLNTDFTLNSCLFVSVKLTKNADPDKYKYSSYRIVFDSHSEFSLSDGSLGKNVFIFEVNMGSYVHIHNKNKNILIP